MLPLRNFASIATYRGNPPIDRPILLFIKFQCLIKLWAPPLRIYFLHGGIKPVMNTLLRIPLGNCNSKYAVFLKKKMHACSTTP